MKSIYLQLTILSALLLFVYASCKSDPYRLPFEDAGGFVIGKEQCHSDTTKDYWLIDLSIYPAPGRYSDTLVLNGNTYTSVVKTTGLDPAFKREGARVGFDFHLSAAPVQTTGCDVANPVTFRLKEMKVLNQSEIR